MKTTGSSYGHVNQLDQDCLHLSFIKSLHDLTSSLPEHGFTFDSGIVIKYQSRVRYSSKERLSGKLATFLAILCVQKAGEILSVIDQKNIYSKGLLITHYGDFLKNSTRKFHTGEIKFPRYHDKTI